MEKDKGFTLVELLAVIVILSVIALIAIPVFTNIISDSKEKTASQSIELFARNVKNLLYDKKINNDFDYMLCNVEDGNVMCEDTLLLSDKNKINGTIILKDDEMYYGLELNNQYFSSGHTDEDCFYYEVNDNDNTVTLSGYKSSRCPADVIIPSVIDGKRVIKIKQGALRTWNATSIIIPNSVTTIDNNTFRCSTTKKLESVIISNSVTSIGSGAFLACNLKSVTIPDSVTFIGSSAFDSNYNLTSFTIEGTNRTSNLDLPYLGGFLCNTSANINITINTNPDYLINPNYDYIYNSTFCWDNYSSECRMTTEGDLSTSPCITINY